MTAAAVLAIDAGQTGMKVRAVGPDGTRDDLFPGIRTHEALLPQLAAVARAAMIRTGTPARIVTAGVSGLTAREADASTLLSLLEGTGVESVILAHDSTTSFLGAMGDERGAVIAAGTGVVTLAVGSDSVARIDGWGHLLGDAGSGYWIGREALDAVMRSYDGRGPATALRAIAEERWPDLDEAYIHLQTSDDKVSIVASFAEPLARIAADGDAVALAISSRAAGELAHSVHAALARVSSPGDPMKVCAIGGVFRSAAVHDAFIERLRASDHGIEFVGPQGHGIDGAVALADLGPEHPLAGDLSSAHVGARA